MTVIKNNKLAIFISLLVIIGTIYYLISINYHDELEIMPVVQGQAFLDKSFDEVKIYKLAGNWEFYPDILIRPSQNDDAFSFYESIKQYIRVPGTWMGNITDTKTAVGKGTYRLVLSLEKETDIGIRINKARESAKTFINGVIVGASGEPEEANFEAMNKPHSGSLHVNGKTAEIVIWVNNHSYPTGGLTQDVFIGSKDRIERFNINIRAINAITVFVIWIVGSFFFMLFLHRKSDRYLAWFFMFCVAVGINIISTGELLIHIILPDISYSQIMLIAASTGNLAVVMFILFINAFLENKVLKNKHANYLAVFLIIQGMLINILPFIIPNLNIGLPQKVNMLFMMLAPVYILIEVIYNIWKQNESSSYLIVILTSFLSLSIGAMTCIALDINRGLIINGHLLIIVITFSLLFMKMFQKTHEQLQAATTNLIVEKELRSNLLNITTNEIDSTLNILKNNIQIFIDANYDNLDDSFNQNRKNMQALKLKAQTELIISLIDDMKYSQEDNNPLLEFKDMKRIKISSIVRLIEEIKLLHGGEVNVEINIKDNIDTIYAHEQYLYDILTNIIDNAFDSLQGNNIAQKEIRITISSDEKAVIFKISDNGKGIAAEDLNNVFKPFYVKGKNGIGLGLSITKKLVELHDGQIELESKINVGTTVSIMLKKLQPNDNVIDSKLTPNGTMSGLIDNVITKVFNKTILVAMPDRNESTELLATLTQTGYTIYFADTIDEAKLLASKYKIDMVIIDILLLDGIGLNLAKDLTGKLTLDNKINAISTVLLSRTALKYIKKYRSTPNYIKEHSRYPINIEDIQSKINAIHTAEQSMLLAIENEIKFLHVQIAPHFLFNTINTIIALSLKNQEKARQALEYLATYMHLKLEFLSNNSLIKLYKEMELVDAYIEIEKLRFGDGIIFASDIDSNINVKIPPLTIQPLVENAINHGLRKVDRVGTLSITIIEHAADVVIEIKDDGIGMTEMQLKEVVAGKAQGLGFKNVKRKLDLIGGITLDIRSKYNEGTIVTITVNK